VQSQSEGLFDEGIFLGFSQNLFQPCQTLFNGPMGKFKLEHFLTPRTISVLNPIALLMMKLGKAGGWASGRGG